ncbi:MAG: thioredoxin-dependent thiol peroxidase [Chloroflexi bacterium]|nr:thioredoxin-dependent thiol peroxidase [Chloroflexota bacterium]
MLHVGDSAPDFELLSDAGKKVRLSDYRGQVVVVYFYPKDDTPGCTKEACGFRDNFPHFTGAGVILGISPDSAQDHVKFKEKYNLPFTLLSDPDHAVTEKYGAWGEKNNYGKTYMGVLRTTVIVGADGKVMKIYEKVKPEGHAEEVLSAIQTA